MAELSSASLSETDASNNAATPDGWPESQPLSSVNNCGRATHGMLKRFWNRINPAYASTNSSNNYILTPSVALGAYVTGEVYSFRANFANTGNATLNVSGLGAKTIKKYAGAAKTALDAGDIQSGQPVQLMYDSTDMILMGVQQACAVGAEQASTSGTSIDFTGIPAWAKRITIMFVGVSTNGTSNLLFQIGDSGGVETSGYLGSGAVVVHAGAVVGATYTAGFGIPVAAASNALHGSIVLTLENAAAFTWTCAGMLGFTASAGQAWAAGSKSLSAALDRVRITTANGTDAFDAGAINIQWS